MLVERETIVSLFIAAVAILAIISGFSAFTGLAVHSDALTLDLHKTSYHADDIFDADAILRPATFLKEESLVIYLDGDVFSVVSLQKYLDDNGLEYGLEYQNAGSNNIQVINLMEKLSLDLSSFVLLDKLTPGIHTMTISLSEGDASVSDSFSLE